ncbi:C40 family peptidase [Nocardioides sp. KIGAM211]|uniref:C40 family peptidase n=1 Tax=Nocardioides luti TaxID=2761101 RepID=A0A7X0RFZ2_9ACTN|nr:C40 family peptidase [Nocardioides luti]
MRALRVATAVVLTLAMGGAATGVSFAADDDTVPSRHEVHQAREAARAAAGDVDAVRAQLAVANQRLQDSAVAAAQAAEAFNGARYEAQQARAAARSAAERSAIAHADVARQQEAYGDALVTSYEMAPTLTALSAIADSDGIATVIDRTTTMHNAEDALDGQYDVFRAAATLADVADQQAAAARADADAAADRARTARDQARAAADAATAQAADIARQKTALIAQLAELQDVSVRLATRRQSALEAQAQAAAAAAQQAQQEAAQAAAQQQAEQEAQDAQQAEQQDDPTPGNGNGNGNGNGGGGNGGGGNGGGGNAPAPQPTHPTPTPTPTPPAPTPPPAPPAPPAPSSGAPSAIAFARAQIGEPYRWGAAGPDAWDCSGLMMGAWAAGGLSLPHYSVAQYEQSTPVAFADLRPGDLVFWGSSSSPSSIYHVALYLGGGQIIEAPRAGVPVRQSSVYAWTLPNFYARP